MASNADELLLHLLRLSNALADEPTADRSQEARKALAQLARSEAEQEVVLYATPTGNLVRSADNPTGKRVNEQASAFTAVDDVGESVKIVLEVQNIGGVLRLTGVLHGKTIAEWQRFTVLLYREGVIEDYTDGKASDEFQLLLPELTVVTLKFLSASYRTIVLSDIEATLE